MRKFVMFLSGFFAAITIGLVIKGDAWSVLYGVICTGSLLYGGLKDD